jgi:hypothetical protein
MTDHSLGLNGKVSLSGVLMALSFSFSAQTVAIVNTIIFAREWIK